jgi:hypothetical protein
MPALKQLTCSVELAQSTLALKEYDIKYIDGLVQCYVAIPSVPTAFKIRLTSDGFIAPGLAVLVYVDGVYQCNRHRLDLVPSNEGTAESDTQVNFVMRQKEEKLDGGLFIGREWRFEKLNVGKQCTESRAT